MFKPIILIAVLVILGGCFAPSFADKIDFGKCSTSEYHHCMEYLPSQNRNITGAPQNWSFDVFLPDGTCNVSGHMDNQGNCSAGPKILFDKNFTAFKMNPFVGSVQNIFSTSSGPVSNYCPIALYTLTHQDGYFYKVQNITNLVYPDYCTSETGPNPYPVPEFPLAPVMLVSIFSIVILLGRMVDGHWVWK